MVSIGSNTYQYFFFIRDAGGTVMGRLKFYTLKYADDIAIMVKDRGGGGGLKNYSPSNIYNLTVKRCLFFCQNKKVQIIQRLPCITKLSELLLFIL